MRKTFDLDGKPIRGYRQRLMNEWRDDQARAIRKNGWLSELELESIRRLIDVDGNGEK